ncbi:UDP-N-acetylmuramoyl-tripeptide--D-alanyl-D-alanine ligase [Bryocella elongata]|uniref:UDP-N-acetylmuramoyl-tripeptide--D-alanyl-D-alanine ligase n=1 Tax=Bryocella elongata TaxID=863522 RepID=A0A1H6B2G8_9BACT|nr:UDP-N-acetylmuramoyl-tripeptide--D-alanyl-D-alanine ligase [Bryocella elongata]SEG54790.1 UDP-N-acetylmuramoyl-tripeptide--D-alanyl-D-alanine ligase [Bryocella elongata]
MKLALGQIADWIHAEGDFDESAEALGYSIDSRTVSAGDLFFAVRGERVDGHDYVESALNDGAIAAVVSMRWLRPGTVDEARLLRIPDCDDCILFALQKVAWNVRRAWGKRVIGVTGSAGKTTTKECIAQVLGTTFNVLKTEGNYNNHFGVPLTLLRLEPEHEVAVLEMGMNHAGEITALAKIAEPNWAVVSNVGPVHLEFFPEGISGIQKAKYELVQALPPDGIAVLNGDDQRVAAFARGLGERALMYGTHNGVGVRAVNIEDRGLLGTDFEVELRGFEADPWPMTLRLPGRHNVLNALAAVAVGVLAGIEPLECVSSLEQMVPGEKRGNVIEFHGAQIFNDTYNSNPRALEAMIRALAVSNAKRRVLIAGEMLELGPEAAKLHAECGQAAADAGIDVVIGVRGLAREIVHAAADGGARAMFVETPEQAGEWLRTNAGAGDVILLKASRGVRLERALDALALGPH